MPAIGIGPSNDPGKSCFRLPPGEQVQPDEGLVEGPIGPPQVVQPRFDGSVEVGAEPVGLQGLAPKPAEDGVVVKGPPLRHRAHEAPLGVRVEPSALEDVEGAAGVGEGPR